MPEIKPCPKCGTHTILVNLHNGNSGCWVCLCCDYCGYEGPRENSEIEAIVAWNKVCEEANDVANIPTNPDYYSRWKMQPLDFIQANDLDFMRGNIIKYIMRYDAKNGLEDLKKARVYLDRLIEKVEVENVK